MTDHHKNDLQSVPCAVATISDSRTEQNDTSGQLIKSLLTDAGHQVITYTIVSDDPHHIKLFVQRLAEAGECYAALFNGGTGLSPRDHTYEALCELIDRPISGFGELMRHLSYQEVGPKAMLTRAVAGCCRRLLLYAMPGAPNAVELAMNRLILPTLAHTVALIRQD